MSKKTAAAAPAPRKAKAKKSPANPETKGPEAEAKPAKANKAAQAGNPEAKAPEAEVKDELVPVAAKAKAPPKKAGDGTGPGVIGSIAEFLAEATEQAPLSKQAILAKLVERFPDRLETSLKSTVAQQVPTKLRSGKGLNVQKNDGGYFIKQ